MDDRTNQAPVRVAASHCPTIPIDNLVPYENNAKIHGPEQLAKLRASLRAFGFVSPVLIDEQRNVIAGHGRIEAARAEGMTEVPYVLVSDLTEAQRRAYIIADNRLAEAGEWDAARLKFEMQELEALQFDVSFMAFSVDEQIPFGIQLETARNAESAQSIDANNLGCGSGYEHTMVIDGYTVAMTAEEKNMITQRLEKYVERHGVTFGFVRELCRDD